MVAQALVRMMERYGYLFSQCPLQGIAPETIRDVVRQIQFEGMTNGLSSMVISRIIRQLRLPCLNHSLAFEWCAPSLSLPVREIQDRLVVMSDEMKLREASSLTNANLLPFPQQPTPEVKRVVCSPLSDIRYELTVVSKQMSWLTRGAKCGILEPPLIRGGSLGRSGLKPDDIYKLIGPDTWINDGIINAWCEVFNDKPRLTGCRWMNMNTYFYNAVVEQKPKLYKRFKVCSLGLLMNSS
jgi:hypothetical protein